jgi:large subunit ribosomal protein L15
MNLNELKYTQGSRKEHTRRCRGVGSGLGKNGGSGHKGQKSRSGGGVRLGFEGGQNPIFRRLPKRGFKNPHKVTYAIINLDQLNSFKDGSTITLTTLVEKGLIPSSYNNVKILGDGELNVKLTVKANKFSKSAEEAIKNAGGTVEVL